MKKYIPLKNLFKEAFLSIFIPQKTFRRIPKNPRLNYRQIIPLLFFSGFAFLALHRPIVHNKLFYHPSIADVSAYVIIPFFSLGAWAFGSLFFYYTAKVFKKNVSLKRAEVAMFYLWFVWLAMPFVDLLHPLLGIPYTTTMVWGVYAHIAWFFAFPAFSIETFFVLKDFLKFSGKKTLILYVPAIIAPIINRFFFDKITIFIRDLVGSRMSLDINNLNILLVPVISGMVFSLWLIQKGKYTTLRSVGQTALICLLLLIMSTSVFLVAPLVTQTPSSPQNLVLNNPSSGSSRFTHSYTFTSSDLNGGATTTDTGAVQWQWFATTYTGGVTFDFTPSQKTISDIKILVTVSAVTDVLPANNTAPQMQGCYGNATLGSTYYCSDWTTITAAGDQTYTISSSSIRSYVAGTSGNQTSGDGAALTSTDWDTLVASMAASGNYARVHVKTDDDGAGSPNYDSVSFTVVQLIVDYRTLLDQVDWEWWENTNNITPVTQLTIGGTNTAATNVHRNDVIRLRIVLISFLGGDLTATDETFKLQYAQMAGATCAGGDETWVDVGAAGSTTAVWRGNNTVNPDVTDGTTLTTPLLGAFNPLETYEDQNPSAINPSAITYAAADYGEWDWVIQNNLAFTNTAYCFRMATATGVNNVQVFDDVGPAGFYWPKVTTANDVINLRGKVNLRGQVNLR